MTDEKFQRLCDEVASAILDATKNLDPTVRIVALTGVLGAVAHTSGATREQTFAALNSVFDDI